MNIVMSLSEVVRAFYSSFNFSLAGIGRCMHMALFVHVHESGENHGVDTHRVVNIALVLEEVKWHGQKGYLVTVLLNDQNARTRLDVETWEVVHDAQSLDPDYECSIESRVAETARMLHDQYMKVRPGSLPTTEVRFFVDAMPRIVDLEKVEFDSDRKTAKLIFP